MKVLIAGGMGVIGAETSRSFVKEGHRPMILARHRDDSLIGDIDLFDPKSHNGETGCVFAKTIVITEDGARRMHSFPTDFRQLPV